MAAKKDSVNAKRYKLRVTTKPEFCGIDAGGVQFAHGEAIIPGGRMVEWFREHKGYEVVEVGEATEATEAAE